MGEYFSSHYRSLSKRVVRQTFLKVLTHQAHKDNMIGKVAVLKKIYKT